MAGAKVSKCCGGILYPSILYIGQPLLDSSPYLSGCHQVRIDRIRCLWQFYSKGDAAGQGNLTQIHIYSRCHWDPQLF